MDSFGPRLAELRKQAGLSQAELASVVGVSQATISRLESSNGYPKDMRLLSKISKALGEPLSVLLPEDVLKEFSHHLGDSFFAFCPNPFCDRNTHGIDRNGQP